MEEGGGSFAHIVDFAAELRDSMLSRALGRQTRLSIKQLYGGRLITCRFASSKGEDRLIGDYPEVPFEYNQYRDPYKKYYDQQNRRNFNEPIYHYSDLTDVWSPDRFDLASDATAVRYNLYFIGGVLTFFGVIYLFFYPERPAVKRNYPYGGLYKALGGTEEDKQLYQVRGTGFQ